MCRRWSGCCRSPSTSSDVGRGERGCLPAVVLRAESGSEPAGRPWAAGRSASVGRMSGRAARRAPAGPRGVCLSQTGHHPTPSGSMPLASACVLMSGGGDGQAFWHLRPVAGEPRDSACGTRAPRHIGHAKSHQIPIRAMRNTAAEARRLSCPPEKDAGPRPALFIQACHPVGPRKDAPHLQPPARPLHACTPTWPAGSSCSAAISAGPLQIFHPACRAWAVRQSTRLLHSHTRIASPAVHHRSRPSPPAPGRPARPCE